MLQRENVSEEGLELALDSINTQLQCIEHPRDYEQGMIVDEIRLADVSDHLPYNRCYAPLNGIVQEGTYSANLSWIVNERSISRSMRYPFSMEEKPFPSTIVSTCLFQLGKDRPSLLLSFAREIVLLDLIDLDYSVSFKCSFGTLVKLIQIPLEAHEDGVGYFVAASASGTIFYLQLKINGTRWDLNHFPVFSTDSHGMPSCVHLAGRTHPSVFIGFIDGHIVQVDILQFATDQTSFSVHEHKELVQYGQPVSSICGSKNSELWWITLGSCSVYNAKTESLSFHQSNTSLIIPVFCQRLFRETPRLRVKKDKISKNNVDAFPLSSTSLDPILHQTEDMPATILVEQTIKPSYEYSLWVWVLPNSSTFEFPKGLLRIVDESNIKFLSFNGFSRNARIPSNPELHPRFTSSYNLSAINSGNLQESLDVPGIHQQLLDTLNKYSPVLLSAPKHPLSHRFIALVLKSGMFPPRTFLNHRDTIIRWCLENSLLDPLLRFIRYESVSFESFRMERAIKDANVILKPLQLFAEDKGTELSLVGIRNLKKIVSLLEYNASPEDIKATYDVINRARCASLKTFLEHQKFWSNLCELWKSISEQFAFNSFTSVFRDALNIPDILSLPFDSALTKLLMSSSSIIDPEEVLVYLVLLSDASLNPMDVFKPADFDISLTRFQEIKAYWMLDRIFVPFPQDDLLQFYPVVVDALQILSKCTIRFPYQLIQRVNSFNSFELSQRTFLVLERSLFISKEDLVVSKVSNAVEHGEFYLAWMLQRALKDNSLLRREVMHNILIQKGAAENILTTTLDEEELSCVESVLLVSEHGRRMLGEYFRDNGMMNRLLQLGNSYEERPLLEMIKPYQTIVAPEFFLK